MWFMALTAGQDYQWLLPWQLAQYGRWDVVLVAVLQPLRRDWREKLDEIRLELPGYSQCSGNWVYSTIWGSSLSHRYYREASRAQGISQLSYLGWVQLNSEGRDQSAQGRGQ